MIEREDVWDSGLIYIKDPKILVPYKVLTLLKRIDKEASPYEWIVLLKGVWTPEGLEILGDEYVIPKQRVTTGSAEITEDVSPYFEQGFNVLVHGHPMNSFSYLDRELANGNYLASIVFNNNEKKLGEGVINVKINDDIVLAVKAKVEVFVPELEGEIQGLENIEKVTERRGRKWEEDELMKRYRYIYYGY